jgi:RHH-type rel operon transcriptional repressor/antitoxin RelB
MSIVSVRLAEEATQQLEQLAVATGRKKSYLVAQAIDDYLAREAWQVQEVQAAIKEADAGDFADAGAVVDTFRKWGVNAG